MANAHLFQKDGLGLALSKVLLHRVEGPYRLTVRTRRFQCRNQSSILCRVTSHLTFIPQRILITPTEHNGTPYFHGS